MLDEVPESLNYNDYSYLKPCTFSNVFVSKSIICFLFYFIDSVSNCLVLAV